ncbi:MAG: TetR/AcrR family transcriptional regulator [Alkalispirochaeta sp.]
MKVNRRNLLIRSGMELFSRYGYRDVSVEDIVRRAGLSVGTFYKYFRSKEAYYEQILGLIEREGIRKAQQVVARLHSPVNKLKAVYQFVVLGMRKYPILRGVLSGDERFLYPGFDLDNGAIGALRQHIEELVAEIIRDGSRRGIFRPGLYEDANRLVMALLDTMIAHLDDPEVEALSRDMLRLMQRGLRRAIRLRRRDERRDRRLIQDDEDLDWLET